ncbi:hypothetical protein F9C07_4339 [Aspergillus flavus]|uniref:Uncharacterized protein n=1 Tax=Aspergillus flavus (strain ATCC 200026 / FGSC A1120 / IAM 13836 / NRRL 3357 / JCM 12722 / SRRC 167) TaxID=332952 RepID=A0A7U2MK98_ASPFN|nr:hypothetical protein F9C07_4339 [Aspergillus flavus]
MATPSGVPTTLHTIIELLKHPLVPIVSSMVAINISAELVPLITVLVLLGDIVPRGYYYLDASYSYALTGSLPLTLYKL